MRENTDQKKLHIWTLFTQCIYRKLIFKGKKFLRHFNFVYFNNFQVSKHFDFTVHLKHYISQHFKFAAALNNKCFKDINLRYFRNFCKNLVYLQGRKFRESREFWSDLRYFLKSTIRKLLDFSLLF